MDDVAPWRYRSIVAGCRSWLPRLDVQFDYCGKTRQAVLFLRVQVRHPETRIFKSPEHLRRILREQELSWGFPYVLEWRERCLEEYRSGQLISDTHT